MEYCIDYDITVIGTAILCLVIGFNLRGWLNSYDDKPDKPPLETPKNPYSRPMPNVKRINDVPDFDDGTPPKTVENKHSSSDKPIAPLYDKNE